MLCPGAGIAGASGVVERDAGKGPLGPRLFAWEVSAGPPRQRGVLSLESRPEAAKTEESFSHLRDFSPPVPLLRVL